MKNTAATLLMLVLSVVTACAPSVPTPTPTPEPTPTPAWVLATKPEHLEGLWFQKHAYGRNWLRWEADGTVWHTQVPEESEDPPLVGRFWFEDGVYYEEGYGCWPIGSYRAYLRIEADTAVRLRFEVIDEDPSCGSRKWQRTAGYTKADR
jgi:hypothetical protein